jgi:catechol 2,3-dioxygenase
VGLVALTVADLERSLAFYTLAFGFAVVERGDSTAALGAGGVPLLYLAAQAGVRPMPARATGLYHFAVLVPSRADLGRWLRHWLELGFPSPGQGDHLVSEALYLSDSDGNGIEIYRDRPRGEWAWAQGQVRMAVDPVDIAGLLVEAERDPAPWTGLPAGTRVGHIHLQVSDIARAEAFYHGVLGFDVTAHLPGALFVSAGGYHHHIGLNTWRSRGAGPAPADSAGLRFYTLDVPGEQPLAAVVARARAAGISVAQHSGTAALRDQDGNLLLLRSDASRDVTGDLPALLAALGDH